MLEDAIRVRLDTERIQRLDRVEAYWRGKGRRDVNRSTLIRDAVDGFLTRAEAEVEADRAQEVAG